MESVGIDINDTRTLVEILSDGGCIESVKSILQLLLVASYTTEGEIKRKYFWFIEEIIAKIILDQKGISPDFTDHFGTCVFDVVDRILLDDERNQEGGTLFQKLQNAQRKISSLENDYNVLVKSRNVGALTSGFVENDQIKSRDRIIETLRNEMKSYRDETDRELIQVRKKLQDALDSTKTRDSKGNASTTEISEDAIPRDSKFSAVSSSNSKNVSTTEMSEETPTFYTPTTSIQNLTEVESSTVLVPSGPVPPPPPPPMMGGPIGAPPPPPFGISSATPKRVQKYYPLVEVKKLQWEKINDQDMKKSIWAKKMTIKLDSEKDDEIEKFLNEAGLFTRIEANFATRIIKQEKVNVPSNQAKIIDPKRSMNIMIMLNQLKKHTLVELRDGILQLNEDIYTPQVIKNCLKFIPTSKEEMLLKNADDKNIDVSEKFMVNMMNVFRYQQRLTCLLFKIEGVQELNDLSNRVETTIKSFETLKKANAFQKLLQIVLNIGNFLNHGTSRGGYHGFSISSLNKLCDMKTSDNQKSLLYYLVELVEQKFLLVKEFKNELEIVVESCKFQFSLILEDLIEFRKSIELVNSELVVHREKGDEVFLNVMEPFYNEMESSLVQFNKRHEKMESLINETMVLYAADQKTKPDEFLAIFKTFLDSYNVYLFNTLVNLQGVFKRSRKRSSFRKEEEDANGKRDC